MKNARPAECFMMAGCAAPTVETLIHWEWEKISKQEIAANE
jgi:hypothetical protein